MRDEGVPGLVIHLSAPAFCEIRIDGRSIAVGGGALLGRVVTTTVHRGLAGLETLIGIPGTVGGALHGNAGAQGGNIGQWTFQATVVTAAGEIADRSGDDLVFNYRQSSLDELAILEARCELEEDDPRQLPNACRNIGSSRKPRSRWGTSPPAACSRIRAASAPAN